MPPNGVLRIDLPQPPLGEKSSNAAPKAANCQTLDCFVAGPENRLAVAALENLLLGEGTLSAARWTQPFVLVGPAGTGKSSLVRGIVRRWHPLLGPNAVGYFMALDFARRLTEARLDEAWQEFTQRLEGLQLLVLEDLDKLPSKQTVQLALRTLLDGFLAGGGTVLCTARHAPQSLSNLESGLRDRLAGGLLLCLNQPGAAARLELIRLAAAEWRLEIEDRQLRTLAESVPGSAPEVLRALREWELARTLPQHSAPRQGLETKDVIAIVARYFGITQSALRGPVRRKTLVLARSVAVYLLRTLSEISYAEIGRVLGNRDHTTIMHAKQVIEEKLTQDHSLQQMVEELRRIVLAV